jgi:hypothetical protein
MTAAVRERAIGIRERKQRHLGAAERKRIAVVVGVARQRSKPSARSFS